MFAAVLISAGPCFADAPPEQGARRGAPASRLRPVARQVLPARHQARRHGSRAFVAPYPVEPIGPGYGPLPALYPGYDAAAPAGPVAISEYREAYIGRGLFYNTPPQPYFPAGPISVKY